MRPALISESVPSGISPAAIQNDASSTKTSDPNPGRGEWNTQQTNGAQSIPRGTSQLVENQVFLAHSRMTGAGEPCPVLPSEASNAIKPSLPPSSGPGPTNPRRAYQSGTGAEQHAHAKGISSWYRRTA
ncbi:hypothetical protein QBC45DRAFT_470585 [Copromyces sp. CBS 386.78]|nr:hypothetical protein QBC45DRAFT_470585 [Copromyces sp. CBS 386.78]